MPPALNKSFDDQPWFYVLGLRDGRIIHFQGAELCENEKWIHLIGSDDNYEIKMSGVEHGFARGLDVRIKDIIWVADAPDGS